MTSKNLYHRRLVDQARAKSCWICYRPSTTVLITPDSDDWFHICPSHLTDRNFATAKDAEDIAKQQKEQAIQAEIDMVKKEFDEKVRKKLEKRKEKDAKKDKSQSDQKAEEKKQDEQDEKEKQQKLAELEQKKEGDKSATEGPRIFELGKSFYDMRLRKKREVEVARNNRAKLQNAANFPSVPTGFTGK